MGEIETEEVAAHVWERMPGEPGNWYARFETFRLLVLQYTGFAG